MIHASVFSGIGGPEVAAAIFLFGVFLFGVVVFAICFKHTRIECRIEQKNESICPMESYTFRGEYSASSTRLETSFIMTENYIAGTAATSYLSGLTM